MINYHFWRWHRGNSSSKVPFPWWVTDSNQCLHPLRNSALRSTQAILTLYSRTMGTSSNSASTAFTFLTVTLGWWQSGCQKRCVGWIRQRLATGDWKLWRSMSGRMGEQNQMPRFSSPNSHTNSLLSFNHITSLTPFSSPYFGRNTSPSYPSNTTQQHQMINDLVNIMNVLNKK